MKGTEKQIKYAMDILAGVKEDAEKRLENAKIRIAQREAEGKHTRFATRDKKNAERVLAAITALSESDCHAGKVIDRFCSFDAIWSKLECHDCDVEKMIRYTI